MDEKPVRVFDLMRMLWGAQPAFYLLEVAVRTAVMYLYALVLLRFLGKRGLSELTPFEYLMIIAMGSAVGDPMFYPTIPVLHSMVVLGVIVGLQCGLLYACAHWRKLAHAVKGRPVLLVRDGKLLAEALERESVTRDELFMTLREAGVDNLGQIDRAYLEPSGAVSVLKHEGKDRPGLSILPEDDAPPTAA